MLGSTLADRGGKPLDWNRFSFEYHLHEDLRGALVEVDAHRLAVDKLVLPASWREALERLNRVRAVHGTTALEGNRLTQQQVGQVVVAAEHDAARAWTEDEQEVRNAARAQDWVKSRFASDSPPLRADDAHRLHELVTGRLGTEQNQPGRLRQHSVFAGTEALGGVRRAAPPARLAGLMQGFREFINSKRLAGEHPVVQALLAHFFLVTIHPFGDGNGRVSRLLEAGILYRRGYNVHGFYGLSNYFYRNRGAYIRLLQQSRRRQPFELGEFVGFGVRGFREELQGINDFIQAKQNHLLYRDLLVRAFNQRAGPRRRLINRREYNLLSHLLRQTEPTQPFTPPVSAVPLAELREDPFTSQAYASVTARTFDREVRRLEELSFLRCVDDPERALAINLDAIGMY